jgi:post-segregation antitoxin (ccd killing protein)
MSNVQIAIQLPEELVERAKAAGLDIESITPDVITLLEARLKRRESWQNLINTAETLQGSLPPEEIEAELAAAKAERIASTSAK